MHTQPLTYHVSEALRYFLLFLLDTKGLGISGLRTITVPVNKASRLASAVRSEFQTLEDEIADTSTGHDHDGADSKLFATSNPSNLTVNATATDGTGTTIARSNHRHQLSSALPVTQVFSDVAAEGDATTPARSNHKHGMPTVSVEELPAGAIVLWDGGACPTGFTRVTSIDNKFLQANSAFNAAAGGNDTVTITGSIASGGGTQHLYRASPNNVHRHQLDDDTTFTDGNKLGDAGSANGGNLFQALATGSTSPIRFSFADAATQLTITAESAHSAHSLSVTAHENRPAFAHIILCKKN